MKTTFEWDPAKSRANARKHGLPLDVVPFCFEHPLLAVRQMREGEERWLAVWGHHRFRVHET